MNRVLTLIAGCVALMSLSCAKVPEAKNLETEGDASWRVHLQQLDEALAQDNVSAAVMAWHEAYIAALQSRRWEGMVEVGDASLRLGRVPAERLEAAATARRTYLAALMWARQQGSLDGVLRAAEAFAALGDREVAEQCLRIAEGLAGQSGDGLAATRVRAFREQMAEQFLVRFLEPSENAGR